MGNNIVVRECLPPTRIPTWAISVSRPATPEPIDRWTTAGVLAAVIPTTPPINIVVSLLVLLRKVLRHYAIDPKRIAIVGVSAGGTMALQLGYVNGDVFSMVGPRPKRTVIFVLTTGEEVGLFGTRWYIAHPIVPLSAMAANLEIEMDGRPDSLIGGPGKAWLTGSRPSDYTQTTTNHPTR